MVGYIYVVLLKTLKKKGRFTKHAMQHKLDFLAIVAKLNKHIFNDFGSNIAEAESWGAERGMTRRDTENRHRIRSAEFQRSSGYLYRIIYIW